MEAAYKRKKSLDLTAEYREAGWSAVSCLVEVGCRGIEGTSTQCFLNSAGITGPKLKKASKDLGRAGELLALAKKE